MGNVNKLFRLAGAAGLALAAFASAAMADGEPGGVKDAPADEGRKFTFSITIGGTSDYIFRGLSQAAEEPAAQGSVDIGYGIFYAGVFISRASFAGVADSTTVPPTFTDLGEGSGPQEVDVYAGIKPVLGPVTFDLGVIYYGYPSQGGDRNVDYVEFKTAASVTPVTNLTLTVSNYYSPDNQFESGEINTTEGTVAYAFPQIAMFTPTLSGTYGYQKGFDDDYVTFGLAFGEDEYSYYNVGLALAVEKFTFDFRYWGTDLDDDTICDDVREFNCSDKFVFSAKVTLP